MMRSRYVEVQSHEQEVISRLAGNWHSLQKLPYVLLFAALL